MKRMACGIVLTMSLAGGAGAAITPMNQEIPEQEPTLITCALEKAPSAKDAPFDSTAERKTMVGEYHYRVWLPEGYAAQASRRWPVIFIASPSGNANLGTLAEWIRKNGYVAVMLVESKNGESAPCMGNFLAAHDDAMKRFRLMSDHKVATGFSGGARVASKCVQMRPGFHALILQGAGASQGSDARYLVDGIVKDREMRVAMTMGETDSNKSEIERIQSLFRGKDKFQFYRFPGGHAWAPAAVFEQAANWATGR